MLPLVGKNRSRLNFNGQRRNFNIIKWYLDNAKTTGQLRVKKDLERGNLWEFHELKRTHLYSPKVATKSVPFPKTLSEGKNLLGESIDLLKEFAKQKCSLVIVSQKRVVTESSIYTWRTPFRERYPNAPIYEIMIPQNIAYLLLNIYTKSRIRSQYPVEDQKNVITVYGLQHNLDPDELGINVENSLLPYLFLVDSKGTILWFGVGKVEKDEWLESLYQCYEKVLEFHGASRSIPLERRDETKS